jgi:predicted dehydrogenase
MKMVNHRLTRRGFLGEVAAGAASWNLIAAAEGKIPGANSKIEAGMIGLGGRGKMIAHMVDEHGGFHIKSVCDYFPEVADEAGEKYGVPKARRFSGLNGYRGLLASGVDAVFLETPPYCFPDHVTAAVDAGCHVYMAKPVACDVPGTLRVADAAKKARSSSRVFLIDFQMRTEPLIIEGIERVHRGEIGELGIVFSQYLDEGFPDPPLTANIESRLQELIWVNDTAIGGSYLVNAGIHAVDAALWIAGKRPISAVGSSRIARQDPHGDSHDVYSITYEFGDGLVLNHFGEHLKNRIPWHCDAVAHCRDGHLEIAYEGLVRMLGNKAGWPGGEVRGLYERGARHNIAWFNDSIRKGDCSNTTVQPSIDSNLAVILGREAAQRKTRLSWDEMLAENKRVEPDLTGLKS